MPAREASIVVLRAWSCALLVAAAWLPCAATALARPPGVHLDWERPVGSSCPSRSVLQTDVKALMGRRVFTPRAAAQVILRGVVEDGSDGVSIHIEATDDSGEPLGVRDLNAAVGECAALREAIGLVLTLFVDYDEASIDEDDSALGIGAKVSLAQAPLPRIALSAGPAVYLALGSIVRLHASAAYWLPVSIETPRGVGAKLEALSLELAACAHIWQGLGLCTGIESGALIASPQRLVGPERQVRLLAHGILEASWELDLHDLAIVDVAAGALLSLSRPAVSYFTADGEHRAVYRPQAAGMIFRIGVIIPTE